MGTDQRVGPHEVPYEVEVVPFEEIWEESPLRRKNAVGEYLFPEDIYEVYEEYEEVEFDELFSSPDSLK